MAELTLNGAPRDNLGPNSRIGVVAPYIVIYRHIEADNTVVVHRIVHSNRDVTDKILKRP